MVSGDPQSQPQAAHNARLSANVAAGMCAVAGPACSSQAASLPSLPTPMHFVFGAGTERVVSAAVVGGVCALCIALYPAWREGVLGVPSLRCVISCVVPSPKG